MNINAWRKVIVLFSAILVTMPLLYYALHPVRIVHISIQPKVLRSLMLFSNNIISCVDGNGDVFFDLDGYVEDHSIQRIIFSVWPTSKHHFVQEGKYYKVSKGVFWATAIQLESPQWIVPSDEQYSFIIVASDGTLLSQGNILSRVESIAGGNQWLIGAIGLLAAVLQILSFLV